MQSTSAQVMNWLTTYQSEGGSYHFTAARIAKALPQASVGGITAFLHRLHKAGAITVVDRVKSISGKMVDSYSIVDLSNVRVVENYSGNRRSAEGRARAGVSTRAHLAGLLLQIAGEVEQMKGSISDFTTEELLKELGRRTKGV